MSHLKVASIIFCLTNLCAQPGIFPSPKLPLHLDFDHAIKMDWEYRDAACKNKNAVHRSDYNRLPPGCSPEAFLDFLRSLYNKNSLEKTLPKLGSIKKPSIPYTIHHIWFGSKIPIVYEKWRKEWQRKHPKWKLILWDEKRIKKCFPSGFFNQTMFDLAREEKNYGKMSDVARYEILHRCGGLYVDCDCRCFQSFESLHKLYDFYAGLPSRKFSFSVCNAVIAAKKQHPIIKQCLHLIKSFENKKPDLTNFPSKTKSDRRTFETIITTGPMVLTQAIYEMADNPKECNIIFPPQYFYKTGTGRWPGAFCTHYHHHTWIK